MVIATPDKYGIFIVKVTRIYSKWNRYINTRCTLVKVIVE